MVSHERYPRLPSPLMLTFLLLLLLWPEILRACLHYLFHYRWEKNISMDYLMVGFVPISCCYQWLWGMECFWGRGIIGVGDFNNLGILYQ